MNRIKELFATDSKKLIVFITAGFPNKDSTKDLVLEAIKGGADMIEIGIPFSDPQADGPVIQEANEIALKNGITLLEIFEQVKEIREETDVPIALMGYYNPILRMGTKDFIKKCNDAEIDGVILPDLPLDESVEFCNNLKNKNISPILLVAPNTSEKRIKKISKLAGDLIYAVSILGITGNDLSSKNNLENYLAKVRENSETPFMVGFGISSNDDVNWFNSFSDGAVVGSAIIKKVLKDTKKGVVENFVKNLKK